MNVVILSVLAAVFTLLWIFCIGAPNGDEHIEGNIFSFVGKWLNKKYQKEKSKQYKLKVDKPIIYKAMGICFVCTNFWVSVLAWLIGFAFFDIAWWNIFIIPLLSHLTINLLYDKFYNV